MMRGDTLQLLIIDDSPSWVGGLQESLRTRFRAVELVVAETLAAARSCLITATPDLVVCEWQLLDGQGFESFVTGLRVAEIPFILLTEKNDLRLAVKAIKAGAFDCLLKNDDIVTELAPVIEKALAVSGGQEVAPENYYFARLKGGEEKFRTFFECAAAGMVTISPEGGFLSANEAFCLFSGYSRQELAELQVSDITHPQDQEITEQTYRRLGEGKIRAISYRKRFICKEGAVRWGHVSVAAVAGEQDAPQYYVGLVQDITEYKLVQDQIRESKQMLQLVLDYIPQFVFWKDHNSVYLGCNRNFAQAAGFETSQQLVGKTDFDLPWTPEEARFYRDCDRRVMDADQPELHIIETQLQANGKQVWIDTNKIPLHDAAGNVVGILGTFEDITERKRAEDELVKANRELDAFVYTVSHDLRTPLTPIISYAEALLETYREQLDDQALDWLAKIESQGRRMLAVMEDLLQLARVGHVEPLTETVDSDQVLDELLLEMGSQIAERGVKIITSPLPPLRVPATLLTQLFDNLISNALRYAGTEGSPIEISGDKHRESVCLAVCDHGPGIKPAELEDVFELFYRGTGGRHLSGTGVGLATVQKIARLFDGRAWAEETPGGGCTIKVELRNV